MLVDDAPDTDLDAPTWKTVLRRPGFRRIWLGHGLSAVGSNLTMLALPLFILAQTGSLLAAGAVGTVRMLVYLTANLPGGALADRLPRRSILLAADGIRALAVLTIGVSIVTGHALGTVLLLALASVDSAASAVADPAGTAATRHLVAERQITTALSLEMARANMIGLVAPALGGVLYAFAPAVPFLADSLTYVVSLVAVFGVRLSMGGGTALVKTTLVADIGAGFRYVARSRFLVAFIVWAALLNFATAGITFGLVVVFGPHGSTKLGLVAACCAVAGIAGAAMSSRFGSKFTGPGIVWTSSSLIVVFAALVTWHPGPITLAVCVASFALLGPMVVVPLNTRLFAVVPDEFMGRVQSSVGLTAGAIYPFADVVSGWLAQRYSLAIACAVFTGILVLALGVSLAPALRSPQGADV